MKASYDLPVKKKSCANDDITLRPTRFEIHCDASDMHTALANKIVSTCSSVLDPLENEEKESSMSSLYVKGD
jgi:hypothetical protein